MLLAERVSFHRVVLLTDLHQRDNLPDQHKVLNPTYCKPVSSPQTRCLKFLWQDDIITTNPVLNHKQVSVPHQRELVEIKVKVKEMIMTAQMEENRTNERRQKQKRKENNNNNTKKQI